MFGNLGLHILKCPTGKYTYVGSIPAALCLEVPATTSDVMGQRAHKSEDGSLVAWKTPVFESEDAARDFALARGFDAK